LGQLPPGFEQTRLVYLHFPTVTQSLSLLQAVPVTEHKLVCAGHSPSLVQALVPTVQVMDPIEVCVLVDVWVEVEVWVPVEVCELVEVCVEVKLCVLVVVCVLVEVWLLVAVCVAV
jgi:hypothetical protein